MFRVRRITATSSYLKNYFLLTRLADPVLDADPPAIDDVESCLACDSTAFYVGELDGKPIGTVNVFKEAPYNWFSLKHFLNRSESSGDSRVESSRSGEILKNFT